MPGSGRGSQTSQAREERTSTRLVQHGSVFTAGPAKAYPYTRRFLTYSLSLLIGAQKSGNAATRRGYPSPALKGGAFRRCSVSDLRKRNEETSTERETHPTLEIRGLSYEPIDLLVLLIGYAISGERTLADFFERLSPFGTAFMALDAAFRPSPSLEFEPLHRL